MAKQPPLITGKGDINHQWTKWYMETSGAKYLDAHEQLNERIRVMDEPSLTTSKGNPNPVWVTWYRLRKKVPKGTALKACKDRIKIIKENSDERPKEHRIGFW